MARERRERGFGGDLGVFWGDFGRDFGRVFLVVWVGMGAWGAWEVLVLSLLLVLELVLVLVLFLAIVGASAVLA